MKLHLLFGAALVINPSFVLGSPTKIDCSPQAYNKNPALPVVKILQASSFCSQYLHYSQPTIRRTQYVTTTVPKTTGVSSTKTITYTETQTTVVSEQRLDVKTVTGPAVTITSRPTQTVSVSVTDSFTTTATVTSTVVEYLRNMKRDMIEEDAPAERQRQLEALGLVDSSDAVERRGYLVVPGPLKKYSSAIIAQACKCYVPAPTPKVVKITKTVTQTTVRASTQTRTASKVGNTVRVSLTSTYSTTSTTSLPGVSETETIPETKTVTDVASVTQTQTATATATTYVGTYTRQFAGSNCVQNKYNHYDLVDEAYTTDDRMFQVCAARCDSYGSGCASFFAYQDNDYPYTWCIIDNEPYDASYRQCSIPFSGRNLAYNAPSVGVGG